MKANQYISQIGQDKFIIEEVSKHKRNGYFVDVGAYDGITISNTYVLEKSYAWDGICVEPSSQYEKLTLNRSCHCENSCLSATEGQIEFVENGWDSCGKGYSKNVTGCRKLIKTTTLMSVLDNYSAPQCIDYLSIDVEGMEYEILKNFNFDRYIFSSITVEHNNQNNLKDSLDSLLTANKYRCILSPGIESWYLHESINVELDGMRYAEMYYKQWHDLWSCTQQLKKLQNNKKSLMRRLLGF